jgi:hypothetical protein
MVNPKEVDSLNGTHGSTLQARWETVYFFREDFKMLLF